MKILRYVAVIIWWVYLPDMTVSAQDIRISDPYANYPAKKAMYAEYSRWSIGLNGGVPFFAGNFRSMSLGNNYWGGMAGIQAGYQINPLFGVRMSVDYGVNKAGSKNYEDDFILLPMRKLITMSIFLRALNTIVNFIVPSRCGTSV